ncbi:MAG: serpin family protein [Candidatus Marinimicrobia bacterium]|nr:serpin family protein [Candidatus Neomarinimicrobiota bacterium]
MKKLFISGMIILLVILTACGQKELIAQEEKQPASAGIVSTPEIVIKGLNEFSFDIYQTINKSSEINSFISPLSISAALGMTYAGAESQTALEMKDALHYGPQRAEFHSDYGKMLDSLTTNTKDFEINIANAVWVQKQFPLLKGYERTVKKDYRSESRELDFVKAPEKSRIIINDWVENKTNDRIQDLIPSGIIDPDTRMILTNAVYFNAEWSNYFNEEMTRKEPFYLLDGLSKDCDMMYQRHHYQYSKTSALEILEIPYKGYDYSMLILLPKQRDGLKDMVKNINVNMLEKHDESKRNEDALVYMPKFKLETDYELKPHLAALGMKEAFTDNADFSGMTGKKDLKISSVIHKAFIEVDERKTEAAAATAVVMKLTAAVPCMIAPIEFRADHPFIFIIRHNDSKAIIFMGQLTNPESK